MSTLLTDPRVPVVGVTPGSVLRSRRRLFTALEMAFPVIFRALEDAPAPSALIAAGEPPWETDPLAATVPTILFAGAGGEREPVEEIRLLEHGRVDPRVRGITLPGLRVADHVPSGPTAEVLAVSGSTAVWTLERDPGVRHRVSAPLPELEPTGIFDAALWSEHSLAIVAITHFLRGLCESVDFTAPKLRAAFVFDDPNVRRRDYGFINYEQLVRHADEHNYHAVMAMVPRDAVQAHVPTASLFEKRADRVSLAFHGNDHLKDELMTGDAAAGLALCAQAVRRVTAFEARTGLTVDRVMNPPHGACSQPVAHSLAAVGFDALCALHPQPWCADPPGERHLAGWEPATFAGPLAVIPRFPLFASSTEIALRAFMGQPLVLYGHHTDVASGLDLLEQAAARVNALGDVQWLSLGDLASSNFAWRLDGDTVVVRPYAGRVRLQVPARARRLIVEEPRDPAGELAGWSSGTTRPIPFGESISCQPGAQVEVRLRPEFTVAPASVPTPSWQPWAPIRRLAAESRDRLLPLGRAVVARG